MSDDIVTRLRHWANGAAEQGVQDVVDGLNYAADEIERLRRNTGCARNQRWTQFCAEALDAQRDVETLKAELVTNADEFRETLTTHRRTIECLTAERDHAVREAAEARQAIFQLRNKLAACCGSGGAGPHTTGPTETFIPEAL